MSKALLTPAGVRFDVADVIPASKPLPQTSLRAAFQASANSKLLLCHEPERGVLESERFHPLIAAAAVAYQHHYPLALSPDALWLTILQGVAQHINNNSERLRSRLVPHQTKIELVVDSPLRDLPADTLEMLGVTQAFTEQIMRHLHPDKRPLLQAEFGMTTDVERIAGAVALMDALQPYFDYICSIICGIPSVILEGEPADWELLESKVRGLHESDLELSWWTSELLPLCGQFVRAAKGDVDRAHWNNLLKMYERYGVDDMNGWLLKFIPYVRNPMNGPLIHQNPVLRLTTFEDTTHDRFRVTGCISKMLPLGISAAPVVFKNQANGAEVPVQFIAGFAGVAQSTEDLSLKPVVSWGIAEQSPIERLISRIRKEYSCAPPKALDALHQNFETSPPGDIRKFYAEVDGISFRLRKPNRWGETACEIFPAAGLKFAFEISRPAAPVALDFRLFASSFQRSCCFAIGRDGERTSWYVLGYAEPKFQCDLPLDGKVGAGRIHRGG